MSPVEGLEGGVGGGRGGVWKGVRGVCERPLPTLTHHLHLHLPTTFASVTRPLPTAHCPAEASPGEGGEGFHRSSLPWPAPCLLLPAPLLPCSLPAPELHTPWSWPLRLSRHFLSSAWSPPSLLSPFLLEPRAGRDTVGPFTKRVGLPLGHRIMWASCHHLFPIDMTSQVGRSGALQDLRRRPTGEGDDGTRAPTRQHVPFGVLLQMGRTAPANARTWRGTLAWTTARGTGPRPLGGGK
jgi:hypothetical protein